MGDNTKIEWADASWNPLRASPGKWACARISDGCDHCYAAAFNVRQGGPDYGKGESLNAEVYLDADALLEPLRWQRPRRIFVCSMTDLYGSWVSREWQDRILAVAALAPQHTFLILTKRPQQMARQLLSDRVDEGLRLAAQEVLAARGRALVYAEPTWPLPNVWLGVSVELDRFTWRAAELAKIPAAVRWVSAEPLLGPLDALAALLESAACATCRGLAMVANPDGYGKVRCPDCLYSSYGSGLVRGAALDWIVTGGESGGPAERRLVVRCSEHVRATADLNCLKCDGTGWMPTGAALAAVRTLRDAAERGRVAFFHKQWGGPTHAAGGRKLDGRTWDQYPARLSYAAEPAHV